jgi:prevent-host-death family protein
MKTWRISEAKAQFSAVLRDAAEKPQIICRRGRPEAAVLDIATYRDLSRNRDDRDRPTVSQLLAELRDIQNREGAIIEVPEQVDRKNPFDEEA